MTLLTKGMGVVKKIMAKTPAGRKDQWLDTIRKKERKHRAKTVRGSKNVNRKVNIHSDTEKTMRVEPEVISPEVYSGVSSASDEKVKKILKHKGYK